MVSTILVTGYGTIADLCAILNVFSRLIFLRPVHNGDYSRRILRLLPKPATVAEFANSCRIRQQSCQSPFLATVAEIGDYSLQCGQAIRYCCCRDKVTICFTTQPGIVDCPWTQPTTVLQSTACHICLCLTRSLADSFFSVHFVAK